MLHVAKFAWPEKEFEAGASGGGSACVANAVDAGVEKFRAVFETHR